MNKLKEWLLNFDNDDFYEESVIKIISITSLNKLNEVFDLIRSNHIIILKIDSSKINQRIKDIIDGYLFACNGYVYIIDSSTILLSKSIKILLED